jgi:hypothetical protein
MKLKNVLHKGNGIFNVALPPSYVCHTVATPKPTVSGECSNVGTPPHMIHHSTSVPNFDKTIPLPTPIQQLLDKCIEMQHKQSNRRRQDIKTSQWIRPAQPSSDIKLKVEGAGDIIENVGKGDGGHNMINMVVTG